MHKQVAPARCTSRLHLLDAYLIQLTNLKLLSAEKSGKTLHLLKSGSKPIKPRSKRKKVEVLGTLKQFHESK